MNAQMNLSHTDRAILRRALLKVRRTTAGLSDDALITAYRESYGADAKLPAPAMEAKAAPKIEPKAKAKASPEAQPDAAAQLLALAKQLADENRAHKAAMTEARIVELIEEHAPRILRDMLAAMVKGNG